MKVRYAKIDYLRPGSINYSKVKGKKNQEKKKKKMKKGTEEINQMRTVLLLYAC